MATPERLNKITRRDFLKMTLLGIGALGGAVLFPEITEAMINASFPDSFEGLRVAPTFPLPRELQGLLINSPFLWCYPNIQSQTLAHLQSAGTANLRLFADDRIEPNIGKYNTEAVGALQSLHTTIEKQVGGSPNTIVSLYDSYGMKIRENPVYGKNTITSPYCDGSSESYRQFFTEKGLRKSFLQRADMLIDTLGGSSAVGAWEVGNEFVPPEGPDGHAIFQDWYLEVMDTIHEKDKTRPIITGVDRPWHLDERDIDIPNVINSIHIYPPFLFGNLHAFLHSEGRRLPLFVEETGFPERLLGVDLPSSVADVEYNNFIHKIVRSATFGDKVEMDSLGLWKVDGYDDGYPDPLALPLTRATIGSFVAAAGREM